jgi:nitrite reductase/ring-hydroxylating ferredoxin subunit
MPRHSIVSAFVGCAKCLCYCVVTTHACRCHGSKFDVTDGAVVNGPAQDPVETDETREVDGTLKIEA